MQSRSFIQSVYAISFWAATQDRITAPAINTAHKADQSAVIARDGSGVTVLLVRDPLDVVVSRTFRKEEYRSYLGHGASDDLTYLRQNLKAVRNFYRQASRQTYDVVVSYEAIHQQGDKAVKTIFDKLGIPVREQKIRRTIRMLAATDAAKKANANQKGVSKTSGLTPDMLEEAQAFLADVRQTFGYGDASVPV